MPEDTIPTSDPELTVEDVEFEINFDEIFGGIF